MTAADSDEERVVFFHKCATCKDGKNALGETCMNCGGTGNQTSNYDRALCGSVDDMVRHMGKERTLEILSVFEDDGIPESVWWNVRHAQQYLDEPNREKVATKEGRLQ